MLLFSARERNRRDETRRDETRERERERKGNHRMAPAWVKEYVEKHKLQAMFEEAANAVVKAKAPEPTSFLVREANHHRNNLNQPTPLKQIDQIPTTLRRFASLWC